MAPPPTVTGLSPIEGPPGTKVTIRGEFLGLGPQDLVGLKICGCDCLLSAEWKSPNKIIARSGPGKGKGDVIVITRSGGVGTCTVQFRSYHETIGPMKESAVWVEETWGRSAMSPTSFQQEDPLGLSVEPNEKKIPVDLDEMFPNTSSDLTSEQFNPVRFLLENHSSTSFNDLLAGCAYLKRKVEGQKEGELSFLKSNVGAVLDQLDAMVMLKEKFEKDASTVGNEPIFKLERTIKEAEHEASKMFDEVLARRERANSTRIALNVLTRFKFLFCMPSTIDKYVKKGEYDLVINDYVRVKSLFKDTEVPVFQKALQEIENKIQNLRETLYEKLQAMPITVEEQKRLIRYLVNLEASGEPAWCAITSRSQYIESSMKQCYDEHKALDVEDQKKNKSGKYSKYNNNAQENVPVPQCVLFFEELCEILSNSFPDLWKLGQAYFTGELIVKVEQGKSATYKHMVLTTMTSFCTLLRGAILPQTLSDRHSSEAPWSVQDPDAMAEWLPQCLRCIRSTYSIFIRLDLPGEALDIVSELIADLRLHSMVVLFRQATEKVKSLSRQETWKLQFTGSDGGITELPKQFEKTVEQVCVRIRESVLLGEQREKSLLENEHARKELDKRVQALMMAFAACLESLALKTSDDEDNDCVVSQLIGTPKKYRSNFPSREHKLLIALSNCQHTKEVVLPKIRQQMKKNGFIVRNETFNLIDSTFNNLDTQILEAYLEQKCDPIVGTIEPSMYLAKFEWNTKLKPTDVKPYVKECIDNLIGVHSEVYGVSRKLVDKIMSKVIETVAEELARLMSCVDSFSTYGKIQAIIDITALKKFVFAYTTPKAQSFIKEAVDAIPPLEDKMQEQEIEDVINKFESRMKLQLCFQKS